MKKRIKAKPGKMQKRAKDNAGWVVLAPVAEVAVPIAILGYGMYTLNEMAKTHPGAAEYASNYIPGSPLAMGTDYYDASPPAAVAQTKSGPNVFQQAASAQAAAPKGSNNPTTSSAAKTGQEAHRLK